MPRHSEATLAAIKQAVDIVALVGDYLELHRQGSKFKALCPFHNDHNPSLEINPERQSFKCWSCGAGGDIYDFVQRQEKVDFPEALRMLAERAGIVLDLPAERSAPGGPSKSDLLAAVNWAQEQFAAALAASNDALHYVNARGITNESVARFGLGFAPDDREWLQVRARRHGFSPDVLLQAGLITKNADTGVTQDKFRGRLMFPIRDIRGKTVAFGGRILPATEKRLAELDRNAPKYLNSAETPIFHKSRLLYAADVAREAARSEGWVAVVEGYTDVIAVHQAGLPNVVGTLGTAFGEEHVRSLRRLTDRVVLLFDGDEAGQNAAEKALAIFLAHDLDVRVLSLPDRLDPAEFVAARGVDALRTLVSRAVDPLDFVINRAATRYDFRSVEGARQAAEWVLSIFARIPQSGSIGLDLKVAKALDVLGSRLGGIPIAILERDLRQLRGNVRRAPARSTSSGPGAPGDAAPTPTNIRLSDLDRIDRELVEIILNQPAAVSQLYTLVPVSSLRDAPLRAILRASYDIHEQGELPTFERVLNRLEDPAVRSLAAGLQLPIDPLPLPETMAPAPVEARLAALRRTIDERLRQERIRDLKSALAEVDRETNPEEYEALRLEYLRLFNQRPPDTRKKINAS